MYCKITLFLKTLRAFRRERNGNWCTWKLREKRKRCWQSTRRNVSQRRFVSSRVDRSSIVNMLQRSLIILHSLKVIQQVILGRFITCLNIEITFSNVRGREGKNGSHLVSWLAPGCLYLDRAERRNSRSVTKGSARCDGKEENEKERLPFFLLPITPRASLDRVSLWESEKRPGTSQPTANTLISRSLTSLLNSLAAILNILKAWNWEFGLV